MNRLKSLWRAVRGWKGWRYVTAVRLAGAALGLVGVRIGVWTYLTVHGGAFDWLTFAQDYGANISTTLVGFTVAVLVIDVLNERRANRERKRAVIAQMGSPVLDAALEAVRLAKLEGWDKDGSLREANLRLGNLQWARLFGVNLQMANLFGANLQKAILLGANLRETSLAMANLQGTSLGGAHLQWANLSFSRLQTANLFKANLEEADLSGANLENAELGLADLRSANLRWANLQGADLFGANLQNVNLDGTIFDEHTTLPDASKYKPGMEMSRFTNPSHPDFWRSDEPESPAYRGKEEDIP